MKEVLLTKRPGCGNTSLFLGEIFGATVVDICFLTLCGKPGRCILRITFICSNLSLVIPLGGFQDLFVFPLLFACEGEVCWFLWRSFYLSTEVARGEFKSLLAFLILQLQELFQSQQFPMLMQGLSLVNNCTFDNIKPLEHFVKKTVKAAVLKKSYLKE